MSRLSRSLGLALVLSSALAAGLPSEARACGGGSFYTVASSSESVATTGHRVVIAMSKTQTVLWDQIQFTGNPEDFAWVYPIKPGAVLELATDAWLESLDGSTAKVVHSPSVECYDYSDSGDSGGGCSCLMLGAGSGSDGGGSYTRGGGEEDPVEVVHQATIGPYETATISSDVPGAIGTWLQDHGYNVPAEASPVLNAYAADGYDFIALRLTPGNGVSLMKPVRVVTPGPTTTFPMRMLGIGGADKVALSLFVITEGRVKVDGYANAEIDPADITWDFASDTSDYAFRREQALAQNGGAAFLTSYSKVGELFVKNLVDIDTGYDDGGDPVYAGAFAKDYLDRAVKNGDAASCSTVPILQAGAPNLEQSGYTVVDLCDDQGVCMEPQPGELDSRMFTCGDADDLSVALVGMHPRDVWLTRLEANLPRAALDQDLVLTPVQGAGTVELHVLAGAGKGDACAAAPGDLPAPRPRPPVPPSAYPLLAAAAALASAVARRLASPRRLKPSRA